MANQYENPDAEHVHITHINDTKAGLTASLDNCQIAIETDFEYAGETVPVLSFRDHNGVYREVTVFDNLEHKIEDHIDYVGDACGTHAAFLVYDINNSVWTNWAPYSNYPNSTANPKTPCVTDFDADKIDGYHASAFELKSDLYNGLAQNYLTKYNGSNDFVNSNIYNVNSRVGVLTNNPQYTLDVAGDIYSSSTLRTGVVSTGILKIEPYLNDVYKSFTMSHDETTLLDVSKVGSTFYSFWTGLLVIGSVKRGDLSTSYTVWDAGNLTGDQTAHHHDSRYYTETEADGRFLQLSGGLITGNLRIKDSIAYGSVKIIPSTDNAETGLGFFQDAAGADNNDAWVIGQGLWGNAGKFIIGNENNGAGGNVRLTIKKSGEVGFGIADPSYTADINGSAYFRSARVKLVGGTSYNENIRMYAGDNDYSTLIFGAVTGDEGTGVGQWSIWRSPAASNYDFIFNYNGSNKVKIDTSGNIAIGSVAVGTETATPNKFDTGLTYSNGKTKDKLKYQMYPGYGFSVGNTADNQYHADGSHDFYIDNVINLSIKSKLFTLGKIEDSTATATPTKLLLDRTYSDGNTKDKCKIVMLEGTDGSVYGFSCGSNYDNQYHSQRQHDFYGDNVLRARINGDGITLPTITSSGSGSAVRIDSNGLLTKDTSSIRYKENIISDINTEWLYDIQVCQYDRKDGSSKGEIGIIAEELALIKSNFITYDKNGNIDGYNKIDLIPVLINEVQRLRKEINQLRDRI